MKAIAIKSPVIRGGENIVEVILSSIKKAGEELRDGDVLAIADKVVAVASRRIARYEEITPSKRSLELSKKYCLEPEFVEIVLKEADKIYGGVFRALLTEKMGILVANAGVDRKNVPEGVVALWPKDPHEEAKRIRDEIIRRTNKKIGVILVDSRVSPLRKGTVGVAIGFSGLKPVIDVRGRKDLYGKPLRITFINVVDDLAAVAHLLMGETTEKTPIVIIRDAPVIITDDYDPEEVKMLPEECLYMSNLRPSLDLSLGK
ncbi:coenzyme F420-0:L-glutamate ligase [Candidatus Geothermarchaeota archaeon]|nr:MAG: coenzyme F420-0:L-glutamate ligase [Candidatus Geothermarchaeota archaeon]